MTEMSTQTERQLEKCSEMPPNMKIDMQAKRRLNVPLHVHHPECPAILHIQMKNKTKNKREPACKQEFTRHCKLKQHPPKKRNAKRNCSIFNQRQKHTYTHTSTTPQLDHKQLWEHSLCATSEHRLAKTSANPHTMWCRQQSMLMHTWSNVTGCQERRPPGRVPPNPR